MVWNEQLKREIPDGWEVKKLSEIATTGSGGTPLSTKKEYYEQNKEKRLEYDKEYRERKKEELKKYRKEYYKRLKEKQI